MKNFIMIGLAVIFFWGCTDHVAKLPDYWQYSPGKWIAFKKKIELEWTNKEPMADKFKISRERVKLNSDDITKLFKLVRKKNIKGLIATENALRNKIDFKERIEHISQPTELSFIDNEKPIPNYGEICFYRINTIKNHARSLPAELSVILLDRSK